MRPEDLAKEAADAEVGRGGDDALEVPGTMHPPGLKDVVTQFPLELRLIRGPLHVGSNFFTSTPSAAPTMAATVSSGEPPGLWWVCTTRRSSTPAADAAAATSRESLPPESESTRRRTGNRAMVPIWATSSPANWSRASGATGSKPSHNGLSGVRRHPSPPTSILAPGPNTSTPTRDVPGSSTMAKKGSQASESLDRTGSEVR